MCAQTILNVHEWSAPTAPSYLAVDNFTENMLYAQHMNCVICIWLNVCARWLFLHSHTLICCTRPSNRHYAHSCDLVFSMAPHHHWEKSERERTQEKKNDEPTAWMKYDLMSMVLFHGWKANVHFRIYANYLISITKSSSGTRKGSLCVSLEIHIILIRQLN